MDDLLSRLQARLTPLGAEQKKMFGGVCFMLNGNMVVGTHRKEMLVRVGKDRDAFAATQAGARILEMQGKPMAGYWFVAPEALQSDDALESWIGLALAHNRELPPKAAGAGKQRKQG